MRLIDADELYEKTAKWEERALQNVASARQHGDADKLMMWSAVLTERSAFKYDIADAQTIELSDEEIQKMRDLEQAEIEKAYQLGYEEGKKDAQSVRKTARWIDGYCSNCGCDVPAYIIDWKWQKDMDAKYCPNCGRRMVGDPIVPD